VSCRSAPTQVYDGAFRIHATAVPCAPARQVARTAVIAFYRAGPHERTLTFSSRRRTWDCETHDFHGVDGPFHVRCHHPGALVSFTGLPQGK
jgi:hypothetical protein